MFNGGKMNEDLLAQEKGKTVEDIRREADSKSCAVQKALYFISEFVSGPMCGKCFPCALGTGEAKLRLLKISQHLEGVSEKDIEVLKRIGQSMLEASFCKKGKDTGKFLVDLITNSEEEFKEHVQGKCRYKECISLIEYVINPDLCIMCDKCREVCKYNAIIGEKGLPYKRGYLPYEIVQKRCTKCGECLKVCPTGAIELVTHIIEEVVNK
jgi:ferredoxin